MSKTLLRHSFNQKYIAFDFETCNLALLEPFGDSLPNLPWQLGVTEFCGLKQVLEKEHWIKWDFPFEVGVEAARITGFTWEKYHLLAKPALPILEAFDRLLYNPDYISITANGQRFDIYLHNIFRHLLNKPTDYSYLKRHVDIQVLHKAVVLGLTPPEINTEDWVAFSFRVANYTTKGLKSSLKHMCEYYGVPYDPARHHVEAAYDVALTKEIFNKQLWKLEI